jgi:hypothetical protein
VPASNQSTASLAVTSNKVRGSRPNTSGYVGVTRHSVSQKWTATVTLANPRKRKHVPGLFDTPAEAAAARAAFIEQHGTAAPIPRAKAATVTTGEAQQ